MSSRVTAGGVTIFLCCLHGWNLEEQLMCQSVFLHTITWYQVQKYPKTTFVMKMVVVFLLYFLTFVAKIALALQSTGGFATPPTLLTPISLNGVLHLSPASLKGLGSPWTMPFPSFENFWPSP